MNDAAVCRPLAPSSCQNLHHDEEDGEDDGDDEGVKDWRIQDKTNAFFFDKVRISGCQILITEQCENLADAGKEGKPASDLQLRWKSGQVMEKEVEQLLGKKLGCRWAM